VAQNFHTRDIILSGFFCIINWHLNSYFADKKHIKKSDGDLGDTRLTFVVN